MRCLFGTHDRMLSGFGCLYFSSGPLAVLAPLVTSKSFTPSQELNPLVLCTLEVPSKSIQSPFVACVGIIFKASRGAWVTKCHRNLAFAAHAQAAPGASLAGGVPAQFSGKRFISYYCKPEKIMTAQSVNFNAQ